MQKTSFIISFISCLLFAACTANGQNSIYDTIRLSATIEHGKCYPIILLPEHSIETTILDAEERIRLNRLKNNIFTVYPYALTAASLLKNVKTDLEKLSGRRERKEYIKSIDKTLDKAFKNPLKELSVEQGQVLVKLIDRQTGQNCYSLIREFKSGIAAVMWQSAGLMFSNNLSKRYDPTGDDKEIEKIVREIETSSLYNYELYQQQAMLNKIKH